MNSYTLIKDHGEWPAGTHVHEYRDDGAVNTATHLSVTPRPGTPLWFTIDRESLGPYAPRDFNAAPVNTD